MGNAFSEEALARARASIAAAQVISDHADEIARACSAAGPDDQVVAVVQSDLVYGGLARVATDDVAAVVPTLEGDGWAFLFAPGTSADVVVARCQAHAKLATTRLERMERRGA